MTPRSESELAPARRSLVTRVLPAAIVIGAALAAYHNSFPGIFVFDDFSSVIENPSLQRLWPLDEVLSPPTTAGVGGRPFANVTFALNYAMSGVNPWSYHALNLLLHTCAGILLSSLVRRTLLQPTCPGRAGRNADALGTAVAVLWVVHPLQTAVVNYVSQRTEALMACCLLLTFVAFIRGTERAAPGWRILSVAACALGMASKETMVVAPLLVMLYDRSFVAGTWRAAWKQRRAYYLALAATWFVLGGLMLTSQLGERGVGFGLGVPWTDYALTQGRAVLLYLGRAFWPASLVFDYGWAFSGHTSGAVVGLLASAALAGVTAVLLWQRPAGGFAAAWCLLMLAPTSSVIPIVQQPIAESRMYLPLAGIIAAVVVGIGTWFRSRPAAAIALGAALAVTLSWTTVERNRDYRSEIALWSDTMAKRPENARAHGNLAAALLRAGRPTEAITAATTALKLRPDYPEARHNLGAAYNSLGEGFVQAGRTDEAIQAFETALLSNPSHGAAHNNLGVVLLSIGRVDEAIAHNRTALRIDPKFAGAHYNLGNALARKGDVAGAEAAYEAALRSDPGFARAHNNLGALRLRTGRVTDAVANFEAALRLNPNYAEARKNLEVALRGRP